MRLIILALASLVIIGCKSSKNTTVSEDNNWKNPEIDCTIPSITVDIVQETGDSQLHGEVGIQNFCNKMSNRFSKSNVSNSDSQKIYSLLVESGLTLDEAFGMPDPNLATNPVVGIAEFTSRISILKINDTNYELYYKKTGCGVSFIWGTFEWPKDPKHLNITVLELWKASYPC